MRKRKNEKRSPLFFRHLRDKNRIGKTTQLITPSRRWAPGSFVFGEKLLALYSAGREACHDSILENHDQDYQRDCYHHGCGHD
jgi:hypothetical protein